MDLAKKGDIVSINYTITFLDGTLFDATKDTPLQFELGKNIFLPGIESLIEGMFIGQIVTKTLPAKHAFGDKHDELIKQIPISTVPNHINKKVGQKIEINTTPPLKATITAVSDTHITLDANPKQAGKELNIRIELLDIIRKK